MIDLIPGGSLTLIGAIMMALGGGFWGMFQLGRSKQKTVARAEKAEGYVETREKTDEAEIFDDPGLARVWLRDRPKEQP